MLSTSYLQFLNKIKLKFILKRFSTQESVIKCLRLRMIMATFFWYNYWYSLNIFFFHIYFSAFHTTLVKICHLIFNIYYASLNNLLELYFLNAKWFFNWVKKRRVWWKILIFESIFQIIQKVFNVLSVVESTNVQNNDKWFYPSIISSNHS